MEQKRKKKQSQEKKDIQIFVSRNQSVKKHKCQETQSVKKHNVSSNKKKMCGGTQKKPKQNMAVSTYCT